MSNTAKALLLELLAELIAVSPEINFQLTRIFRSPAHVPQDIRDLAKQTREAAPDDVPH